MPRTVKFVNINDDSTYWDITTAVVENENIENEPVEETETEEVGEPEPPKPNARAIRVSKPKALENPDTVADVDTAIEPETSTLQVLETKPKPKWAANVKILEPPLVVEQLPEKKTKVVRKPEQRRRNYKLWCLRFVLGWVERRSERLYIIVLPQVLYPR